MSDRREILPGVVIDRDLVRAVSCVDDGDGFVVKVETKDGTASRFRVPTEADGFSAIERLTAPTVA